MRNVNPLLLIDFYKSGHHRQYPEGTAEVYSNFTARSSRIDAIDHVVFFGLQYVIQEYLIRRMDEDFFDRNCDEVCEEYAEFMKKGLGQEFDVSHIQALHELGYLPIEIKAISEGSLVPLQVPLLTIKNTHPDFFWLPNYLETLISCELWKASTSATIAGEFRKNFELYAETTGSDKSFIDYQGHDFSMRGMSGVNDAAVSGAGHLLSFAGTDTCPSILFCNQYYGFAPACGSVPATEHSVMCAGDEFETVKRLLEVVHPTGTVSIVADSYDFWKFVTEFLPRLKETIMSRAGKLVIRPDSGDPVKILCGDPDAKWASPERCGLIRCLYNIFGGKENKKGFTELDPHIGAIYGDSITLERQLEILSRLHDCGYASSNVILGIGSYTYQYQTRDTFGFVCKATSCVVDGERRSIFKSPKTGGWKKSRKGLLSVDENYNVTEDCTEAQEKEGILQTVFLDGHLTVFDSFEEIKERLAAQ